MKGTKSKLILHSSTPLRRRLFNRLFALIYAAAISVLLYHQAGTLIRRGTTFLSFFTSLSFLISDLILAFMWINSQAFRMNPVATKTFPENLLEVLNRPEDFPALDVFICTADPHKEPPVMVAATVLSVMAYDYPAEKLSVYVSDDGWSEVTLFALMEAVEFGKVWLPFCKTNGVMERCPEAYFGSDFATRNCSSETEKIKDMYENMKTRVENAVERGHIADEYKSSMQKAKAFGKWAKDFTIQDHPAVVQVISQNSEDKDDAGCSLPNLIYVSRQKSRTTPHHFKAGALNVLLRVSAVMTNSPIILTLDCDMISNDPSTPHKMLCFFIDNSIKHSLGYVQLPACSSGLNNADIYGSDLKRMSHINPMGLNGLLGPEYFGSGTFFNRRAFYGGPLSMIEPEVPELSPDYAVRKPINDQAILDLAHQVASCDYENQSKWGSKIGLRYGSLVEDYYTSYRLHCEGWRSIFCNPKRPAFMSEAPISLHTVIIQMKRWSVGLLEVALSKYSPLTFGIRFIGPLMTHCYSYYAFGPIWPFPIMIYAFLPQLTMLHNISIFPKVSDSRFFLYTFLFLGAYLQDFFEFILSEGTILRWWNDQRMWLIMGLSSNLFGTLEYISNHLGISSRGFDVTYKTNDNDLRKRYDEGMFEFGVASPMFVPLSTAAIMNLAAFLWGIFQVLMGKYDLFGQVVIAGFGVVNSWPIYEAMVLRNDKGKMPTKITLISGFLAWIMFVLSSFVVQM
ncbi:Cellulose synthase (UDP-forming) [Handroanthus impetiginosus]|uniref:Cellulose synthase (UDP-forming) n=1 Tax=Handroanthus impetiginosus TaxID=429701 RepID=A0A2G9GUP5_9LAMI|nr:Cellulose synthase (UDP-forming) [Handroanthus impetiginosus]